MRQRLSNDGRPRCLVPVLLIVALACLVAGLLLPIMEVRRFWLFHGSYSILDGVALLLNEGETLIAVIVFAFSVVLPAAKIIALMTLWLRLRQGNAVSTRLPAFLEGLGKWSMLDVFVVALIVFAAKTSAVADATVAPAVLPFIASIVLTIFCGRSLRKSLTLRNAAVGG